MTSLARKILLYLPVLVVLGFIFICYTPDVYADELLVGSGKNGNTKATNNINTWVDRNWDSSPSYSDSSWNNPIIFTPSSSNWDGWWQEFSYTPNGSDPGTSYSTPKFPFFNRSSANVIQNGSIRAPNGQKNYFRTKYKLPAGSTINNARVYVGVDDFAQIKLNGETVDFSPYASRYGFSSASRYDSGCNPLPVNQWVDGTPAGATGGALNYIASSDVTGTLRNVLSRTSSGADEGELIDLLISAEILNACIVDGSDSPLGVQYALYIDYTPPKNDPPVCGTVTKSPNQTSYLPSTNVTFTSNAADPEEKTLYYSWLPSSVKGVFIGNLTNKQITYRTPSTPLNETVRYIVSDGVNQKECSFNLSTQSKFKCQENTDGSKQCILDPNGDYSDPNTCSINCTTKYSCNLRTNSCEVDPSGVYSTKPSCESDCKGDVSCSDTFIFTPNSDNTSATVTNSVNNFSLSPVSYTWSSTYSSSSIADCTRANTCFAPAGSNTALPLVTYKMPPEGQEDTITLNLGNGIDICTYTVNKKRVELSFDKSTYTGSVSDNITAILTAKSFNNFDLDYRIYLTCPTSLECAFNNTGTSSTIIRYSAGGVSESTPLAVNIKGKTIGNGFTITATGVPTNNDLSYRQDVEATVNIVGQKSLNLIVKKTDSINNKLRNCDLYSSLQNFEDSGNISISDLLKGQVYSGESAGIPSTLSLGNYIFSYQPNLQTYQTYCTKSIVTRDTGEYQYPSKQGSSNFEIYSGDTNVTLVVVVGPKTTSGWFKAFGGNGYAFADFDSSVPLGERLFTAYDKVKDGLVMLFGERANFSGLDPSRIPNNYIEDYGEAQKHIELFRASIHNSLSNESYANDVAITNLSEIDKNSKVSKFYIYNGSLNIDEDLTIEEGSATPVLYVKAKDENNTGTVTISSKVNNLDLVIIADGEVNIEDSVLQCEEDVITDVSTYKAPYFLHVYKGTGTTFRIENYTLIPGVNSEPDTYLIENKNGGNTEGFKIQKPADANYVKVSGYWVQSGHGIQENESSKLLFTLSSGEKLITCSDMDGGINVLTEDLNKNLYYCGSIEGEFYGSSLGITPLWDGWSGLSNGSHMIYVEVDWKKKTKETSQACLSKDPNLVLKGGALATKQIYIGDGSIVATESAATEKFYYRPDPLFSNHDSAEGFKVVNIYLKSLD